MFLCDLGNKRPIAIAIGKNHLVPFGDQIVDHGYNACALSDGLDASYIQIGDMLSQVFGRFGVCSNPGSSRGSGIFDKSYTVNFSSADA
jgi:hypothetical protein